MFPQSLDQDSWMTGELIWDEECEWHANQESTSPSFCLSVKLASGGCFSCSRRDKCNSLFKATLLSAWWRVCCTCLLLSLSLSLPLSLVSSILETQSRFRGGSSSKKKPGVNPVLLSRPSNLSASLFISLAESSFSGLSLIVSPTF